MYIKQPTRTGEYRVVEIPFEMVEIKKHDDPDLSDWKIETGSAPLTRYEKLLKIVGLYKEEPNSLHGLDCEEELAQMLIKGIEDSKNK